MEICVTGSDGYLGRPLVTALRAAGHRVTTLDTGFFAGGVLGTHAPADVRIDARDNVADTLAGQEAVIHLAELSNDPLGEFDPNVTADINHSGSLRLAEVAAKAGVKRFVYFSSCSVYGASGAATVDEATAPEPLTTYARCKVAMESHLIGMSSAAFTPIILRNATAFGPSPAFRLDLVLNEFVYDAVTRGQVTLRSSGDAWRPFVHVLDIAHVAKQVLTLEASASGQPINVGSDGATIAIRDLATMVGSICDVPVVRTDDAIDNRSYRVSFRLLHELLGANVIRRGLPEGIQELRTFITTHRDAMERRGDIPFRRLPTMVKLIDEGKVDADLRWRTAGVGRS
jgi:nucleoside-diphosphate-sugar epimerase